MSLINQMLRDLEARQADTGQRSSVFQGLTGGATPRRRSPVWMAALVIGVAAAAGATAWFVASRTHRTVPREAAEVPAPARTITSPPHVMQTAMADTAPALPAPRKNDTPIAPSQPKPRQQPPAIPSPALTASPPHRAAPESHRPPNEQWSRDTTRGFEIRRHAPTTQQRAASRYQEALSLLRQRQNGQAELKLRAALQIDPGYAQAAEALGALLINEGRVVEAAPIIDAARRRNPQHPTLELLAARVRLAQGNVAGATTLLESGLPFSGGRADYVAFLAALYQKQQKYSASAQAYRRAVELNPDVPAWWVGLAISEEGAGNRRDAVNAYSRALQGNLPATLHNYATQRLQALNARHPAGADAGPSLH